MNRLQNKVIIVTGSTSGIGIGIAKLCAKEGAKVVVCGRRAEKGQIVVDQIKKEGGEEIKSKIQAAKSVVLVDYKGLTVAQDTELRTNFRKAGVEYKVYKNRLAKIAFNELGYTCFDAALEGPTAISSFAILLSISSVLC